MEHHVMLANNVMLALNMRLYEACCYTHPGVALSVAAMAACLPLYWAYHRGTWDDNIRKAPFDYWRSAKGDRVIRYRLAQRRKSAGSDKDVRIGFIEWLKLTPKFKQELQAERKRASNGIVRPGFVDTIFPTACPYILLFD